MPIFEGVLEEISGGSSRFGVDTTMSSSDQIKSMATQGANVTHRQFLVIDGKRIMDVAMSNRHDALLVSSLGQRVRISVTTRGKGYFVMGVRLADGTVDTMGVWGSVLVNSANIALPVIFLVIVGLVGLAIGNLIIAVIGFGLALFIVRPVIRGARGMMQARSEI